MVRKHTVEVFCSNSTLDSATDGTGGPHYLMSTSAFLQAEAMRNKASSRLIYCTSIIAITSLCFSRP